MQRSEGIVRATAGQTCRVTEAAAQWVTGPDRMEGFAMIEELSQDAIEQVGGGDGEGLDILDWFDPDYWKRPRTVVEDEGPL